jgi:hypothetical protein
LAKTIIAFKPIRRGSKTHTAKRFGYLTRFKLLGEIIEDAFMRILKLADVGVREKLVSNTCLA